jgi:hypothetical protein
MLNEFVLLRSGAPAIGTHLINFNPTVLDSKTHFSTTAGSQAAAIQISVNLFAEKCEID